MHILHLYKDYAPVVGGIENHIRALAEAQAQRGHQVTVLVTNRDRAASDTRQNGVRVIKVGRLATVASTPLSMEYYPTLQALRPDITHVQSPYPLAEITQWLVRSGRPYVVSYQADVNRTVQKLIMLGYRPFFRQFLNQARRILATSPNFTQASPMLRSVTSPITLVPIGTDTRRFSPPAAPVPPARPFTVLFVGQLRHYKGLADLLRAMVPIPAARLSIAGNGPMRSEWEQLSQTLGLTDRVKFLGNVPDPDLPALYQSADVFVLPSTSRAESFGTVLVEAMASGLPCITTEIHSGNSYVVQEGVTGWVVPPHDPAALAAALQRLIDRPDTCAQFGAAGRLRAQQEFSVETMIQRVEQVYQESVAG